MYTNHRQASICVLMAWARHVMCVPLHSNQRVSDLSLPHWRFSRRVPAHVTEKPIPEPSLLAYTGTQTCRIALMLAPFITMRTACVYHALMICVACSATITSLSRVLNSD